MLGRLSPQLAFLESELAVQRQSQYFTASPPLSHFEWRGIFQWYIYIEVYSIQLYCFPLFQIFLIEIIAISPTRRFQYLGPRTWKTPQLKQGQRRLTLSSVRFMVSYPDFRSIGFFHSPLRAASCKPPPPPHGPGQQQRPQTKWKNHTGRFIIQ